MLPILKEGVKDRKLYSSGWLEAGRLTTDVLIRLSYTVYRDHYLIACFHTIEHLPPATAGLR